MHRLYLFDLLRMLDFMEQHFREPIDAEDVARHVGYSPWHCRRIFRQYMDESLSKRLLRFRLEASKKHLRNGVCVAETASSVGFSSREGFSKAFSAAYGVSPSQYAGGAQTRERCREVYEYRMTAEEWATGANPTKDGLWEFSYYNTETEMLHPMEWAGSYFEAPYHRADVSDPMYYCQNRSMGYGLHPGLRANAVKTFVCPKSGLLEYFISLGRLSELHDGSNPCSVRLYHENKPLFPQDRPMVLSDQQPILIRGICHVKKGNRIHLFLDAMGHIGRDGIVLYRQEMRYPETTEEASVENKH